MKRFAPMEALFLLFITTTLNQHCRISGGFRTLLLPLFIHLLDYSLSLFIHRKTIGTARKNWS